MPFRTRKPQVLSEIVVFNQTMPTLVLDFEGPLNCLDYTLMNYSHLEYRRLDDKDFWTTPIGLLGHLDYTQNKLHCNLTIFDSAIYFHMKTLKRPEKL